VPSGAAHQLAEGATGAVSQGVAPVPPGTSADLATAITNGSHQAFMDGFQTSMTVAGFVAVAAAFIAMSVRKGDAPVDAAHGI
jgi:hypothetical protein